METTNIYFKSRGGMTAYKNLKNGKSIMVADWGKGHGYEVSIRNFHQGKDEYYSPCSKEDFDALYHSAMAGLHNFLNQ